MCACSVILAEANGDRGAGGTGHNRGLDTQRVLQQSSECVFIDIPFSRVSRLQGSTPYALRVKSDRLN
jgi:hypothetical protein